MPEAPHTLVELLLRAEEAGTRAGLRFLDRREEARELSWPALASGARRVARALRQVGVKRGERVVLVFPTGEDFFFAFFGVLLAAAVPVPVYPPVRLGRLDEYHQRTARMIQAAGARLVLTDSTVRRLLGETVLLAQPELGCRALFELAETGSDKVLEEVPADSGAGLWPRPEELGLVQFSSGTTREPKPVALSHRAILAQVAALNSFWPDNDEVRHSGASWLPLYHDMGLIGCVFPALEKLTDLTLLGPEVFVTRPAAWLRMISRYRATVSPAPNFAYGLCVEKIRDDELDGVDLSSWRVALNGAEAVSARTVRAFIDRFSRWGFRPEALSPVYGLSEASLAVTFPPLDRPFRSARFERESLAPGEVVQPAASADAAGPELVSVGQPLPGFALEVRDDGGRPVPSGVVGRVWVRGPSLMDGYLGLPTATAAALVDGWLDTGDLGFVADGELFLTGRAKDVVILRGRNYAPEEIERALDGVPGVRVGCVVAASHLPAGGDREELVLLVEAQRGASASARAALLAATREAVLGATGLAPDQVVVLAPGTLPRTSSGKLRRWEALRQWLAGELAAPAAVNPLRLAAAVVRSGLAFWRAGRRARAGDAS